MGQRKKRRKNNQADHGPIERQQHGQHVEVETSIAGVKALRNVTVDPIETYKTRKTITIDQFNAADTFAGQYRRAALAAVYSQVRYNNVSGGEPTLEFLEAVQQAKERVRAALDYVGFPLAGILEHVCGDGSTAGSWKGVREARRPDQEGMVALRLALDGLAAFYKIM